MCTTIAGYIRRERLRETKRYRGASTHNHSPPLHEASKQVTDTFHIPGLGRRGHRALSQLHTPTPTPSGYSWLVIDGTTMESTVASAGKSRILWGSAYL